jgi:hypothetical protein
MFVLVEKNKQKVHVDDLISLQLSGQRFIWAIRYNRPVSGRSAVWTQFWLHHPLCKLKKLFEPYWKKHNRQRLGDGLSRYQKADMTRRVTVSLASGAE